MVKPARIRMPWISGKWGQRSLDVWANGNGLVMQPGSQRQATQQTWQPITPARADAAASLRPRWGLNTGDEVMSAAALRVLVAEDEPIIRMLMVETLEDAGIDVLEASDGQQAIRLIDDPDGVDLVVTDLHMPGLGGVAVAQRARERHANIPVLFVSARLDLIAQSGAPPPYRILRKPFTLSELTAAVDEMVGDRGG
jgi:CheY-like chemotaxis protein